MTRKSLYQLYMFMSPSEHEAEYRMRFNDRDAVHLHFNIGEHPAFFCQTIETYKKMLSIERIDKKIGAFLSEKKLPGVALNLFTKRCLIDEIVLTNNIEGVRSSRKDIGNILQDLQHKAKKQRFVGLVNKYALLMSGKTIALNTSQDIRDIYNDIFYEEIKASEPQNLPDGEIFRKEQVSVYSASDTEIHHGLYPESRIISCMDAAMDFLNNDDVEPLLRIAVFHYLFGYIHPFYDGNGRMSRFISSYLLSNELNPLVCYRLSGTIKENLKKYYDAFQICNDPRNKGELTPFVEMFLDIIEAAQQQLYESLEESAALLHRYYDLVPQLPHHEFEEIWVLYYVLIQGALFTDKGISLEQLLEGLHCSYNTLRRRLRLIPEELLIKNKQGRQIFYNINLDELHRYFS